MKQNKIFSILLLLVVISLCFCGCSADTTTTEETSEKYITKTDIITTNSKIVDYDPPKEIDENGDKFNLVKVELKTLTEKNLYKKDTISQSFEYKQLFQKDDAKIKSALQLRNEEIDSTFNVYLDYVDYVKTKISNRIGKHRTEINTGLVIDVPTPQQERSANYFDEATGKTIHVKLPLAQWVVANEWAWRSDVEIPMEFIIYDADFYKLGDKLVPYNNIKPALNGYEDELLKVLGLSSTKYKIDDFYWTSEPYYVGEVRYRKAMAIGQRYCASYNAIYEGEFKLEDTYGYDAIAYYKGKADVFSGEKEYTIEVKMTYKKFNIIPYAVGGFIVVVVPLFLFFFFTSDVKFYYNGKYKGKARIIKNKCNISKIKKKCFSGNIVAVISKSYIIHHNQVTVSFVNKGYVVNRYTIPSSHEKQEITI